MRTVNCLKPLRLLTGTCLLCAVITNIAAWKGDLE